MSVVPLLQLLVLLAVGQLLQDASAISIPRQETEAYSRNSTRQLQDLGGLCTTGHILSDMETACCGAGQAGNGGHRRVQAECEGIPTSCSQECAPMFINYYETCQESVISLFDRPKREAFAALFGECRAAVQNMCVHDDAPADTPTTTHNSWQLAMNINPGSYTIYPGPDKLPEHSDEENYANFSRAMGCDPALTSRSAATCTTPLRVWARIDSKRLNVFAAPAGVSGTFAVDDYGIGETPVYLSQSTVFPLQILDSTTGPFSDPVILVQMILV